MHLQSNTIKIKTVRTLEIAIPLLVFKNASFNPDKRYQCLFKWEMGDKQWRENTCL